MEGNAWLQVMASLCYCFLIGKLVPPSRSFLRLLLLLPVVCFFLYLPLNLHSFHLIGFSSFFIAWLANFKLLLFAFNKGPLSHFSLSPPRFIALTSFPIEFRDHNNNQKGKKSPLNYAIKSLLLIAVIRSCEYKDHFHPKLVLTLYTVQMYLTLEIIMAVFAAMGRTLLGVELEPQFNKPYLSSSPQDFWRRWNVMAKNILKLAVYKPTYSILIGVVGRKWTSLPAVFVTFLVSGLIHELIFYYLGRLRPTWEITWFFILHGLSVMAEIGFKKQLSGTTLRLPRVVSGPLTIGFVLVTMFWLFFPPLLRCNLFERVLQEYVAVIVFLKNATYYFPCAWNIIELM
ncbi:hypothetical protein K1719_004848 [Acacia pycnantha]|nr:hypothetical protein K1719_004848 [Acacia pycnantha]